MKEEKFMRISTKTGDKGFASDYSGRRLTKDDLLFETMGTIDELSSWLGLCYHKTKEDSIKEIQRHLQKINSMIATDPAHANYIKLDLLDETEIQWLESREDAILNHVVLDSKFRLPGSEISETGAWLDLARAVARRAERSFVGYVNNSQRSDLGQCGIYLNRLSDLLFLMAKSFQ